MVYAADSTAMLYTILPVEDADVPRASELVCNGLVQDGIQEFVRATWPGLDTPAGRAEACSRFLQFRHHLKVPEHFLKVVDEATKRMVAISICLYNPEPPTTLSGLSGDPWTNDDDREYAHHLRAERNALLLRLYAHLEGPVTETMAFFVDKSVQRQGIGSLLMNHLLNMDIQQGKPLVLIAQPTAVGFYQRVGLEVVEDAVLPVPPKWQHKPQARLVLLMHK